MATVVAATIVRWLLDPLLGFNLTLLTFYIAVAITAWYHGLRAALLASALGFVASFALFVPSHPEMSLRQITHMYWDDWLRYLVLTVTFALFGKAKKEALERSEVRRETLQVTLS
ncbi:MAG: DUF4118 domain-containing protein, partial [Burkholderiaceae bacterium]|nr:DUF4118 domain-containing protein [Burkholderiaceae bacterium]